MAGGVAVGWDDIQGEKGPERDCPVCPMKGPWAVGTRKDRFGTLYLNPHYFEGHAPPGGYCEASKRAVR